MNGRFRLLMNFRLLTYYKLCTELTYGSVRFRSKVLGFNLIKSTWSSSRMCKWMQVIKLDYCKGSESTALEMKFSNELLHLTCQFWPTYKDLHQLCMDTGCNLGNLPGMMKDKDGWREREKERLLLFCTA